MLRCAPASLFVQSGPPRGGVCALRDIRAVASRASARDGRWDSERDNSASTERGKYRSCPRARGGAPGNRDAWRAENALSPRTRGCSVSRERRSLAKSKLSPRTRGCSALGACGRVDVLVVPAHAGCSGGCPPRERGRGVVPAHAEVLRPRRARTCARSGLSPRTRGCSAPAAPGLKAGSRCPRARGGAPGSVTSQTPRASLSPRTRGGPPTSKTSNVSASKLSPRTREVLRREQGVGVDLQRCPRARGGAPRYG